MKKSTSKLIALIISGVIVLGLHAGNASEVDWDAFSKNLVKALQSSNSGLQRSAMQLVIKYGNQVNVNDAVFDVMRVFRYDKDQGVRRLALTTLTNMNNKWAMGFLKRQIQFEGDPVIKKQLIAVTSDSYKPEPFQENLTAADKDFNKLQEEVLQQSKDEALFTYQTDVDDQPLDASQHSYILRFAKGQFPPAQGFWSVAIYDSETQLRVENPLNRYLIDSSMLPDLKLDADGSLTLYIQQETPGADKESNWLPAPSGPFQLLVVLYWPGQEVLDGTWTSPPIQKVK
ncbi:MAG: hypothetical protein CV087_16625 [Candidatus Brocadia sp. WS118]|nr:MAG: hypothetical protein CV087_16625 [Candidatus Brocadia sp. WS118]